MQALIFLNFALYVILQRMGFVAKWSVAMKFFMSGFTSAFSKYSALQWIIMERLPEVVLVLLGGMLASHFVKLVCSF